MNETKERNQETEKIELLLRKSKSFKFEHVSFIITAFTALAIAWAFWRFENHMWNRVEYSVGLWNYKRPFYGDTELYPTGPYLQFMVSSLLLMTVLIVFYVIFSAIFITSLQKKEETSKKSYILLTSISFMVFFLTWWALQTFWINPENWFRQDLSQLSNEYWKVGIFSLPSASNKEAYVLRILKINVFLASIILIYDLVISGLAFMRHYKEGQKKKIKKERKPLTFQRFMNAVIFYTIMGSFLVFTLFPVVYTFLVSLSNEVDLRNEKLATDPIHSFILNYSSVIFTRSIHDMSFQTGFQNSVLLGVGTAIGGLSISLPTAYAIARYRFKTKRPIEFLVLATQMFPGIILLVPQFIIWSKLGLLATEQRRLFGTLLAYFAGSVAYTVWMMKGYFETIPRDLEEAALIDGSSTYMTFLRISIPLAAPGMAAVGLFTFLGAWNEFALAQIFIGENSPASPLPLLFYAFQDTNAPDQKPFFQLLAAYSMLAALPIIIIFMSLQRLLARGVTAGGVK